jgi:glycosyltransferase XagB
MSETPSNPLLKEYLGPRGIPQATYTMTGLQRLAFLAVLAAIIGLAAGGWALQLNAVLAVFFLLSTLYRLYLVDISLRRPQEIQLDELADREDWPSYVIQVPMYKEPRAAPEIVKAMTALDYPKDRMTVQLLIEEDDAETRQAARSARLEPPLEVVLIPVSEPRTKPKACNVGLALAKATTLLSTMPRTVLKPIS